MLLIQKVSFIILFNIDGLFALESRLEYMDVVPIEEAPFAVLVLCTNSKYYCSGTIMSKSWILSSAHCFYDTSGKLTETESSLLLVAGTNKLSHAAKDIASGAAQIRQSLSLILHRNYHFSANFVYDLAVISIGTDFEITNRTRIAPIDPRNLGKKIKWADSMRGFPHEGFKCELFGFGKVYLFDDNVNDNSLKIQMFNVSKNCECLGMIWNLRWHDSARASLFICEEDQVEHTTLSGLCPGDQGAPLICEDFLAGIATTGFHYLDRDECLLKKDGYNECGSRQTMYVFTDLCVVSQWLSTYVTTYPVVDDNCEPYYDYRNHY